MRLTAAEVDLETGRVDRDGTAAELRPAELALLRYLADRPGRTVDRDEILAAVWGYRAGVRTRTLDTTVKTLRKKIEADPARPDHLRTVHGVGYALEVAAGPSIAVPVGVLFGRDALIDRVSADLAADRIV